MTRIQQIEAAKSAKVLVLARHPNALVVPLINPATGYVTGYKIVAGDVALGFDHGATFAWRNAASRLGQ